jgi:hypothetical protein
MRPSLNYALSGRGFDGKVDSVFAVAQRKDVIRREPCSQFQIKHLDGSCRVYPEGSGDKVPDKDFKERARSFLVTITN